MKHTSFHPTILWADDDTDDLMIMREVLESLGSHYDLVEVGNGREVLAYLEESKASGQLPCLIVLDINMPVMNGKEALAQIKSDRVLATVPVAMFTTSSSERDRAFCRTYDVQMFTKPPSFSILKGMVHELVGLCAYR